MKKHTARSMQQSVSLPRDVKRWLKDRAKNNKRSMSSEISHIIEQEKLREPPQRRPVFLLIVRQRFERADQSDAALVGDLIGHRQMLHSARSLRNPTQARQPPRTLEARLF